MVRWFTGVMVVPVLFLLPALTGCTEPEPLYCDAEHPCTLPGYTCMYSRRTCIFKGNKEGGADTAAGDQGVPDSGGADQQLPDTGGGPDLSPEQGAGADATGDSTK